MEKCRCLKCKSEGIIPILYWYPLYEVFEETERGNPKLSGCELFDTFPDVEIKYFAYPEKGVR